MSSRLEHLTAGPENSEHPPLLLIHGVSHGAWCWEENFLPYFAGIGYRVHALSLRGHGASDGRGELDRFGLEDYVGDVRSVLGTFARRPVLIGHSMGGAITQMLLRHDGQRLAAAVLLASLPHDSFTWRDWLRSLWLDARGVWEARKLGRSRAPTVDEVLRLPFFSQRITRAQATRYAGLLQAESQRAQRELLDFRMPPLPNPGCPVFVLGSAQDRLFGRHALERTARHYRAPCMVLGEGCHDLQLDPDWQRSADCIVQWLRTAGL